MSIDRLYVEILGRQLPLPKGISKSRAPRRVARRASSFGCRHVLQVDRNNVEPEIFRHVIFGLVRSSVIAVPVALNPDWVPATRFFHPNGASLVTCAVEFRAANLNLRDPLSAKGSCGVASEGFRSLLLRRGVIHFSSTCDGTVEVEGIWFRGRYHEVLRIGRMVIDWTAAQFGIRKFPYVYLWTDSITRFDYERYYRAKRMYEMCAAP